MDHGGTTCTTLSCGTIGHHIQTIRKIKKLVGTLSSDFIQCKRHQLSEAYLNFGGPNKI